MVKEIHRVIHSDKVINLHMLHNQQQLVKKRSVLNESQINVICHQNVCYMLKVQVRRCNVLCYTM